MTLTGFRFLISMVSFWSFLLRHITIASTSVEASRKCCKKASRKTSKSFMKDDKWYIFEVSVTSSVNNT